MPLDFLEVIANVCYQFPRPRFIDPSFVYDLAKVRRLVEEASCLALRAADDAPSRKLTAVVGDTLASSLAHITLRSHPQSSPLNPQRRLRMRKLACQKLAQAYRLDERACIVACEQMGTVLTDLGEDVLQHDPDDLDASYVQFFHQLMTSEADKTTDLTSLTDLIMTGSGTPEYWRTRAIAKIINGDFEGAASDISSALTAFQVHYAKATVPKVPVSRPVSRVQLAEHEQPSGLRGQLLFSRGWAYLTAASHQVRAALALGECSCSSCLRADSRAAGSGTESGSDLSSKDKLAELEAKRRVKALAKRSLKDILEFLTELDYSPNLPMLTVREFSERTEKYEYGTKRTRHTERHVASQPCAVYTVAALFAANPPSDLPEFPGSQVKRKVSAAEETCEVVTAHPLLEEALHQLLLCHILLQTSRKELERHAYMVARLVRLNDGAPVLSPGKSTSRRDWQTLLVRVSHWIHLSASWNELCYLEAIEEVQPAKAEPLKEGGSGKTQSDSNEIGKSPRATALHLKNQIAKLSASTWSGPTFRPSNRESTSEISPQAFAIGSWIISAPKVKGVRKKKKKMPKQKEKERSDLVSGQPD